MSCKSCEASAGLVVCLFCGHSFCPLHRGELEGVAACTACLQAEHARRSGRGKAPSARSASPSATPPAIEVRPVEPVPLHEPGTPAHVHGLALAAGAAMGGYLWFFLGWLTPRHGLPDWLQAAGAGAGAALTVLGVWVIAKTHLAPERPARGGGPA